MPYRSRTASTIDDLPIGPDPSTGVFLINHTFTSLPIQTVAEQSSLITIFVDRRICESLPPSATIPDVEDQPRGRFLPKYRLQEVDPRDVRK